MEQELLTLPENLISPQVFSEVRVARSLILCVVLVSCLFSFCHCVVFDMRILITSLVSSNASY
jgi:hypothetical protein